MPTPPWVRDVVPLDAALFFDRILPLVRERAPDAPLVAFVVGTRASPAEDAAVTVATTVATIVATIVVDEATLAAVLAGRAPAPGQRPAKPRRDGGPAVTVRGDPAAVAALAAALRPAAPASPGPATRDLGSTPAETAPMRLPNGRLVKGRRPASAASSAPTPPIAAAASTVATAADPVELALVNLAAWLARL